MANKDQKIKFGVEFDEAAMARMEARIQRFMRMFTGATAKADAETQRRTAEFMASGQGAAYMRNAPPGYRYDPLGANASQIYSSKQSQQHFRAQQQYLRTGKEPGVSFTDRAFGKLHEISERLDPQRRAIGTATGGLADMVSGGLGSSPSQTIAGAGSAAKGLLGLLGPIGRFAGGVIGGAAAGTAAGVALGIPGYREYMSRLPSQEALANRSALPQSFEGLGTVLTKLGHDLQMVGSEAGRLALSFAKVSGATDAGLYDRVRNAGLFARGFGMDPQSAAAGFGRAEYMGFGGSEAKQKQFANLLGRTIAEGGMMGNSEQVMEDMLKHIQGVEQNTGEMPSMSALGEYASLRASLYQNPALKGPGGDSAIGGITSILRGRDNGPKDAFLIGAFGKEIGGSLTNLQWLRDANPFESVRSVTGQGGEGETILDRAMAFSKTMAGQFNDPAELRKKQAALLSTLGNFNSHQAYAFIDAYGKMGNKSIGDVQQWLQSMGQSGEMSEGSIGNQIRLYNTRNDRGGLTTMADEYIKASNTSEADKKALEAAKGGSNEKLATELARVIESTGTQNNELRDHSQKLVDLKNAMANEFGPSLRELTNTMTDLGMELVPFLSDALKELNKTINELKPVIKAGWDWLETNMPSFQQSLDGLVGTMNALGVTLGPIIRWASRQIGETDLPGGVDYSFEHQPGFTGPPRPANSGMIRTPWPVGEGEPARYGDLLRNGAPDRTKRFGPASEGAKEAFAFFKDKGLTDAQAAGIVGNLMQESWASVDPNAKNTDPKTGRTAYGIAQWVGSRQDNLRQFAKRRGKDVTQRSTQLDFLWYELNNLKGDAGYALDAIDNDKNDVDAATRHFGQAFERPGAGEANWPKRVRHAKSLLSTSAAPAGLGLASPASKSSAQASKQFLLKHLVGHGDEHITGLRDDFAQRLASLIEMAPDGIEDDIKIFSGHRPASRQAQLFRAAIKKYGSVAAARKWVAPPGRSRHNHGKAADLRMSDKARDWVHKHAGDVGLGFPMPWEPWHIEPLGDRGSKGTPSGFVTTQPGMARLPESAPVANSLPLTSGATSQSASHSIEVFVKDERGQVIGSAHKPLQPRAKNVCEPGYGQQVAQFDLNHGLR